MSKEGLGDGDLPTYLLEDIINNDKVAGGISDINNNNSFTLFIA